MLRRRSLATYEDGEVRLNTECFAALLRAWPSGKGDRFPRIAAAEEDGIIVRKQAADPHQYLEVGCLSLQPRSLEARPDGPYV